MSESAVTGHAAKEGLVFNIQRFSPHDGPGIRTTVFLKGCPLDCIWCHNPEGISPRPQILVLENRCMACGACVDACPLGLPLGAPATGDADVEDPLSLEDRASHCTVCGACVEACPTGARELAGTSMTVADLMKEVLRDRIFYDDSGGGVTFSGGEPLSQLDFLLESLAACRREEIHTAVDTSGFSSLSGLLTAARLTDLFLYDLKAVDDTVHREATGVSNRRILENLHELARHHHDIWLRVPVVPGVNDDLRNLEAIAKLAASLPSVKKICLLPYHGIAEGKHRRIGRARTGRHLESPSPVQVRRLTELISSAGVEAQIGG